MGTSVSLSQDKIQCFGADFRNLPDDVYCSNCFRSKVVNVSCQVFFYIYWAMFITIVILFSIFRREIENQQKFKNIYFFVIVQLAFLIVAFANAYDNYKWIY